MKRERRQFFFCKKEDKIKGGEDLWLAYMVDGCKTCLEAGLIPNSTGQSP